jgi:hypothetical protein
MTSLDITAGDLLVLIKTVFYAEVSLYHFTDITAGQDILVY